MKNDDNEEGDTGVELGNKEKDVGSISSKDMFLRADKIDFKSWDVQLDDALPKDADLDLYDDDDKDVDVDGVVGEDRKSVV